MSDAVNLYAGWLIDGTGGPVRENALVRLSTRCVHQVSCGIPIGQTHDVTWDFVQSTLLPGLIDSHVHLFMSGTADLAVRENQLQAGYDVAVQGIAARLQRQLDHGVIAVRDGGDRWGHVQRFKGSTAQRLALPIRIFTAGKAWRRPGRYGKLIGKAVADPLEILHALRKAPQMVDHIKIVNSGLNSLDAFAKQTKPQFTLEELQQIVQVAHARGLKTMVHANGKDPVKIAIEAGCDSIEHGFFMGRDNLLRMADRQTCWVPTAFTMRGYAQHRPPGSKAHDIANRNYEHQLEQIAQARDLGVNVVLGTDAGSIGVHHGQAVIEELKVFLRTGASIAEAIAMATSRAADLLGMTGMGRLAPDNPATFVVVPGSPAELPESLTRIEAVFVEGRRTEDRSRGQRTEDKVARGQVFILDDPEFNRL